MYNKKDEASNSEAENLGEETDEGDYMESKSKDFAERLAEMIGFLGIA